MESKINKWNIYQLKYSNKNYRWDFICLPDNLTENQKATISHIIDNPMAFKVLTKEAIIYLVNEKAITI